MQGLKDSSIHVVLTSPPYDAIRDYKGKPTIDLPNLGVEINRVLVDGGIAVVVLGDQTNDFAKSLTTFRTAVDWVDNAGLRLWECLIWNRPGTPGGWWSKRFRVDHEYVLIFLKGKRPRHFTKEHMKIPATYAGTMQHGSHWSTEGERVDITRKVVADTKCPGTVVRWNKSNTEPRATDDHALKRQHPATFPQKLAADMIECFTLPGDTVVDPYCGSGSTLVEALRLKRQFVGIDIANEYCLISEKRLALLQNDKP
jgi:site-specific DNA-methyltransferase (adenine-specific)